MTRDILIRKGRLISAQDSRLVDILIKNGLIHSVGEDLHQADDCLLIDASGKLIFPGVIDPHTHMGIPIKGGFSADDFPSGTLSALHGGVTTILDFTVLGADQSLHDSLAERIALASKAHTDVGVHINISRFDESLLEEIPRLIAAGFNSFKTFTTYKEACMMLSYAEIERVAQVISEHRGILMVHSEDDDIINRSSTPYAKARESHPRFHGLSRPAAAEAIAIQSLGEISDRTGCTIYIVHLNTAEGLQIASGFPNLKVETCPHYLFLDESDYEHENGRMYVASPPLRTPADQTALWNGILEGTIQTVGSDHCPFCLGDKRSDVPFQEIPNGMGGVETLFPTLLARFLEQGLDLSILARLTSANPASIFQLDDQKGSLEPGMDADLMIIDPKADPMGWEERLSTHLDWNAYAGLPALFPEIVIRRGEVVVSNSRLQDPGYGSILKASSAS